MGLDFGVLDDKVFPVKNWEPKGCTTNFVDHLSITFTAEFQ